MSRCRQFRYASVFHITHLNTARNSQTKKPSVTLSAALRNLPSLCVVRSTHAIIRSLSVSKLKIYLSFETEKAICARMRRGTHPGRAMSTAIRAAGQAQRPHRRAERRLLRHGRSGNAARRGIVAGGQASVAKVSAPFGSLAFSSARIKLPYSILPSSPRRPFSLAPTSSERAGK